MSTEFVPYSSVGHLGNGLFLIFTLGSAEGSLKCLPTDMTYGSAGSVGPNTHHTPFCLESPYYMVTDFQKLKKYSSTYVWV